MKSTLAILTFVLGARLAGAQGTLVFDQQSTGPVDGTLNLNQTPFGQSFTPSLDSIGFLELQLHDGTTASTVAIDIRSDSITGTVLGTSGSITIPSNSSGTFDFFFSSPVSLTPGTQYFFEPVVVSGGFAITETTSVQYAGGDKIYNGVPDTRGDLWFREGIVTAVPEPTVFALFGLGGAAACWLRKRRII